MASEQDRDSSILGKLMRKELYSRDSELCLYDDGDKETFRATIRTRDVLVKIGRVNKALLWAGLPELIGWIR